MPVIAQKVQTCKSKKRHLLPDMALIKHVAGFEPDQSPDSVCKAERTV